MEQFEPVSLDDEKKQQEGDVFQPKGKQQEVISEETTLSYNKTTGRFRYGSNESLPISPTSRHKVRIMAEELMKWWKKGKPCPQSKIVRDVKKKIP